MQQAEPPFSLSLLTEEDEVFDNEVEASPATSLPLHASYHLLQAHAMLLDLPVVSLAHDAEAYRLVRTHFTTLRQWHEHHTGWRLQRGPSFFRLERHPHRPTSLVLDDRLKRARDFVCVTWILWFAEQRHLAGGGRNQQFLLSHLAEELQRHSQQAPGAALDFRNLQDRYSMRRALDYLTQLGGLQTLEGEVKQWEDAPEHEVLYEFTPISHSLIEAFHEQHLIDMREQLAAHQHDLLLPGAENAAFVQNIPPLVRAWRTLLLGPALFRYDDASAFSALLAHTEQVSDELAQHFGWLLEMNRDYACIVRGGTLSSGAGPGLTTNGAYDQMILLLCTEFRQQVEQGLCHPDAYGCLHITSFDMNTLFSGLRQRYGSYWGASVKGSKASEILDDVSARMRLFGLLRGPDTEGQLLVLPTAARYSVSYTQTQAQGQTEEASSEGQAQGHRSPPRATRSRGSKTRPARTTSQQAFAWEQTEGDSEHREGAL